MKDLLFDTVTREIVMKDRDFVTTDDPSTQNGGILLYAKGFNLRNPTLGVAINDIVGGGAGTDSGASELSRWKAQAFNDGATEANWNPLPSGREFKFEVEINYL